jgi:hypothetical protein
MRLPIFPELAQLTLEDKDEYNALVAAYPPISDISFTTLHIWWNLDSQLAVSSLNGNLILDYELSFDPENSGFCLIGTNRVDETIEEIFVHLRRGNRPLRLVHVPEFVVEKITARDNFLIAEELDYHEYVIDSHELASLQHSSHGRTRRKVARFLRETEERELNLMSLDLSADDARKLILDAVIDWDSKYPRHNDPKRAEKLALKRTLDHSLALNTHNLCLFVDGKLQGVVLYHPTIDSRHYIINHLRVAYELPFIFDYMTQQIAKKAVDNNVPFLNLEMDLGIEGLRQHKMGLRPVSFFKKYRVSQKA